MPLVIICGTPVSGKTRRARELKEYFENKHGKRVDIVSEDEIIGKLGFEKNSTYSDPQKEKRVRGYIKSEVIKLIGKDNVVIMDGSNYIKGYRYELYCAAKAAKSTICTVYTIRNHDEAWHANQERSKPADNINNVRYTQEVFEALSRLRFEEPNPSNRWDSPLFTIQPSDILDFKIMNQVLYNLKGPPQNLSTLIPALTSTNFLYDLDRITQGISKQIQEAKQLNVDQLKFKEYPGCTLESTFVQSINPQSLLRLRRQFLTYAKMNHSNESASTIGRYYIQYLNKALVD